MAVRPSEPDRHRERTERLMYAAERLGTLSLEARRHYAEFAERSADLPAARRCHVMGYFLTLLGIAACAISNVAHSVLAVPPVEVCILLLSGVALVAIGGVIEGMLRRVILASGAARVGEITQAAAEELDTLLREGR